MDCRETVRSGRGDRLSRDAAHSSAGESRHRPHRGGRGRRAARLRRQGARRERPGRRRLPHRPRGGRRRNRADPRPRRRLGDVAGGRAARARAPRHVEDLLRRGPGARRDLRVSRRGAAVDRFRVRADADDVRRLVARGDAPPDRARGPRFRGSRGAPPGYRRPRRTAIREDAGAAKVSRLGGNRGPGDRRGRHEGGARASRGRLHAALERARGPRRAGGGGPGRADPAALRGRDARASSSSSRRAREACVFSAMPRAARRPFRPAAISISSSMAARSRIGR